MKKYNWIVGILIVFLAVLCIMQYQQKNLSKETILSKVWGYDDAGSGENHVEAYMGFLRKKLQSIGSNLRIEAARRLGYHLEVEQSC